MASKRTVTNIVVVIIVLVGLWATGRTQAQGMPLPPMFGVGQQVVGPAGQVITIAAVHGEWIQVAVPDKYTNLTVTNDPLTGRTLMVVAQWIHVPSGVIWGATP